MDETTKTEIYRKTYFGMIENGVEILRGIEDYGEYRRIRDKLDSDLYAFERVVEEVGLDSRTVCSIRAYLPLFDEDCRRDLIALGYGRMVTA